MRTIKAAALSAAISFVSLLPSGAQADIIFDQSINLTQQARLSDFGGFVENQVADDFQLQAGSSTVTDVHWWGLYRDNGISDDDFTIRIFADISGTPGTSPLNEIAVGTASRVDSGAKLGGFFIVYAYSVDISPLALTAGTTYWLSIVNDTGAEDDWFWSNEVASDSARERNTDSDPWSGLANVDFGFQLTNDAVTVPEPASIALFAAGLVGLGLVSRRRKLA